MPLYSMKEVWTPLKWVGIKFFKTYGDESLFVKIWNKPRRRVRSHT
jgi:hypothetical protein